MIQPTAGCSRSSMVPFQENADIFIRGWQSRGIRPESQATFVCATMSEAHQQPLSSQPGTAACTSHLQEKIMEPQNLKHANRLSLPKQYLVVLGPIFWVSCFYHLCGPGVITGQALTELRDLNIRLSQSVILNGTVGDPFKCTIDCSTGNWFQVVLLNCSCRFIRGHERSVLKVLRTI